MRAVGSAGSIGRNAAPVRATAHVLRIECSDRGRAIATVVSGPAPRETSSRAMRFAEASICA